MNNRITGGVLVTLFLFVSTTLFSQRFESSIRTYDDNPIPYANIVFFKAGKITGGTYANKHGLAVLYLDTQADSIVISAMGFKKKSLKPGHILAVIHLEIDEVELQEATVFAGEITTDFVGIKKEKPTVSYQGSTGNQMITLIENTLGVKKRIKSFSAKIRPSFTKKEAALKIIFFTNEQGQPGEQLKQELIVDLRKIQRRNIVVDLDSLYIFLPPRGLFVGIEWVGCYQGIDSAQTNKQADCDLSIWCNWHKEQEILNQTFSRNIFQSSKWYDLNKDMLIDCSLIPVFGLEVY